MSIWDGLPFANLFAQAPAAAAHAQVYGLPPQSAVPEEHKAKLSHEAIAAAAGFEAMRAYEDHLKRTGAHPSHDVMLELLAAFAAAEVDKLVETKGLDYIDKEETKQRAVAQAHHLAAEKYQGGTGVEAAEMSLAF